MSVLLVAGSPLQRSRSAALLAALGQRLSRRGNRLMSTEPAVANPTSSLPQ